MKRVLCCALVLSFALGCTEEEATSPFSPYAPRFDQSPSSPVVNTTAYPGDGTCDDTECTLWEAIAFADPGATISFAPGLTGTITVITVPGVDVSLLITESLTILGPGAAVLSVSGADQHPLFRVVGVEGQRASPVVEIRDLTIENGRVQTVSPGGGGVSLSNATVSLFNVVVRNSQSWRTTFSYESFGGGIGVKAGDLSLTDCTLSGNWADWGGGVYAENSKVTIAASTIAGNGAISSGGGIASAGPGTLLITNSTISGNEAQVHPRVGGIYNSSTAIIVGSTVYDNIGAEIYQAATGSITVARSILASYSWNEEEVSVCAGTIVDGGYNIEGSTSCGFTAPSLSNTDPLLGPLADNGGRTHTRALLVGSPAVDLVPFTVQGCGTASWGKVDQRGIARPQGVRCDAGAFELLAYPFSDFFVPVDNPPVINSVKAGQAVPVKFSLGGDRGLDIMAAGFPVSHLVACDPGSPADAVEVTVAAGGSSLSYNAATDTYTYVWKTNRLWANSCRRLTLRLADEAATTRTAEFRFTR